MNWLSISTEEYNNLKNLLEKDFTWTMKIIEARYSIPTLDLWTVYFDRDITGFEGFLLGKAI